MNEERLVPRRAAEEVGAAAPSFTPAHANPSPPALGHVKLSVEDAQRLFGAAHTPGRIDHILTMDSIANVRTYSHERYSRLVEDTIAQINRLSSLKGGEYAGDSDRLANFRRNAKNLGVNMETVWAVYAAKHWDAVMQYIQDLNAGKTRTRAEPLSGRLDDIIVYCILFKAMLEERGA